MSKKKAIKITTATAIAASAFVAVAPTQSEAATSSVDKAITKATNQMAKAYDTYHKTAKNEGKLPATGTIRNEVKLAKDYYAAAEKEIAKNGGSKTKKAAYTKTLNAKKYFLDRAEAYLAAINTNLNPAKTAFTAAVETGKAKTVVPAKAALVKDVEAFEATVAKIYGPDVRDLLLEKYEAPATKLANSVNDELKVYEAYKKIEAGKFADLEETAKLIDSVKAEVETLKGKDTKLAKTLVEVVAKNIKAFEEAQVPTVKEVSAINGKQVVITFNKAVDKATVIGTDDTAKDGVFSFTRLNTDSVVVDADAADATLSEDGKSVTLTAATTFNGKYAVQIKGVKTLDAKEVSTYDQIAEFKDITAPKLVEASASGKTATNKVTLRFDEPVQAAGAIVSVNGVSATVASGASLNELVITSSTDLAAGSTANISIINVKDFANNFITPNPLQATVVVGSDTIAPTVLSAEVSGEKKVTVKFDKAVNVDSFVNNVRLLSVNGEAVTGFNAVAGDNAKEVVLTSAADLAYGPNGTFTGNLLIGTGVLDKAGNNLAATFSKSVTFTKDTVAPTVTGISYADGKITVNFSENVVESGVSATLINEATGEVVQVLNAGNSEVVDGKKLVFTKSLTQGNYTIRLAAGSVADTSLAANVNAFDVRSFAVSATPTSPTNDTTKPLIDADTILVSTVENEQLIAYTVTDDKGVDLSTVRNVSNYTFDGKALPTGSYITTGLNNDNEGKDVDVTIHIPSKSVAETKTATFLVNNIKDKAGNVIIAPAAKSIQLVDGVQPLLSSAVVSSGDNTTLVLGFSEAVNGVDATDFVVTLNNKNVTSATTVSEVLTGTDKGKYYVTVAALVDDNETEEVLTDDKLFVELDGVEGLTAGDLVLTTGTVSAGNVNLKASYVTGLKISVADAANIDDNNDNVVIKGTTITLK